MKLVSWNVNGLRAVLKKGFEDAFRKLDADVFCLQETKMQQGQATVDAPGYTEYWHSAVKKGYSGTAVFSKKPANSVQYDFGDERFSDEGRVITLQYDTFALVNVYSPNAQAELARIDYREAWEDSFRAYLTALAKETPVIICGDMNVARSPIDLKNPKPNEGKAGYSQQERSKMELLLSAGFTDSFRHLYPDREGAYTWWTYRVPSARASNVGWRIDYFLVSNSIAKEIKDSMIYPEILGSDHCPVGLEIF